MTEIKSEQQIVRAEEEGAQALPFQRRLAMGLKYLKLTRGLTNRDLAEKIGVSEGYMSQVARGMRDVKLTTLDKMTREWDVTMDDLFAVTEDDLRLLATSKKRRSKAKKNTEASS